MDRTTEKFQRRRRINMLYKIININQLKTKLNNDPTCAGNHHIKNQIKILENKFTINI
jgi:hypothetical protein